MISLELIDDNNVIIIYYTGYYILRVTMLSRNTILLLAEND